MEAATRPLPPARLRGITLLLATLILLSAAFLRIYRLHDVLPGLGFDEAIEAVEAWNVARYGTIPTTLHPHPTEVLSRLVHGILFIFMGPYTFVARVSSVYWGLIAVAFTYQAARSAARHTPYSHLAGLAAAATLAGLGAHLVISRSVFRAVTLTAIMAGAIWFLLRAWRSGQRRDYVMTGLLWGIVTHTYLPGLLMLPALAAALVHQGVFHFREVRRRLGRIGLMIAAMLIPLAGLLALELAYPAPLFYRLENARAGAEQGVSVEQTAQMLPERFVETVKGLARDGGYDPKRGLGGGVPMLNLPLRVLLVGGLAACAVRFRRMHSILLLLLLALMFLPVALSDTLTDALRLSGEYAVIPVLIGLACAEGLTLLKRAAPQRAVQWAAAAAIAVTLVASAATTMTQFFAFYDNEDQWRSDHLYSFVWYFLTPRYELGQRLNSVQEPTYLPLNEFHIETTRFLVASRFPDVRSFSELAEPGEALDLPTGPVVIPTALLEGPAPTTYVLLLPDPSGAFGEIIYLPALDAETADALREQAVAHGELWSTRREGLPIAYQLDVSEADNPFADLRAPDTTLLATFGDGLELVGWDGPETIEPDQPFAVTLYWRANQRLRDDYNLFVHLLDRFGTGLTSGNDDVIGHWSVSPRTWKPGTIVPEERVIKTPAGLPGGPYGLLVGVYPPFGESLNVTGPAGEDLDISYQLWPLEVAPPPTALPDDLIAVDAVLGDQIALVGYTLARSGEATSFSALVPGETFTLTLYWRVRESVAEMYHTFVHVEGLDGSILAASDGPPQDGAYPTTIWDAGEVVATTHTLTLPPEAGDFAIWAGFYRWPDLLRLPVVQDGIRSPEDRISLWP